MRVAPFAAVWVKELRALLRDPHGMVALFVMPAAFILIMSLALRDVFSMGDARTPETVLVQLDQGPAATELAGTLAAPIARATTAVAAEALLRARRAELAVIIPAGYEAALLASDGLRTLVELIADPSLRPELLRIAEARLETAVMRQRITARVEQMSGGAVAVPAAIMDIESTVSSRYLTSPDRRELTATQQNVPAWLVFGMFFVVIPICNLLIAERDHGTLARLRMMLVPIGHVIAGKLVLFYLINMLQVALMLLVGRYLVPVLGGDALDIDVRWPALALISTATSVAALGMAILVASLARTTAQAAIFGNLANVMLAAVGGIMVPRWVMPDLMQSIARVSPMNWALEGYMEVFLRDGRFDVLAPYAASLAGLGLVCGGIAWTVIARSRS